MHPTTLDTLIAAGVGAFAVLLPIGAFSGWCGLESEACALSTAAMISLAVAVGAMIVGPRA